ncbi:MAG: hypothetical protein ACYC6G_14000 [Desulfobaccales bacterium]
MIAKIKEYFTAYKSLTETTWRDREVEWESREKIEEGRRLLEAIGESVAGKSRLEIMAIMAGIGLAHLRVVKVSMDATKAAQEMSRRIQQGPRPSRNEAHLN